MHQKQHGLHSGLLLQEDRLPNFNLDGELRIFKISCQSGLSEERELKPEAKTIVFMNTMHNMMLKMKFIDESVPFSNNAVKLLLSCGTSCSTMRVI